MVMRHTVRAILATCALAAAHAEASVESQAEYARHSTAASAVPPVVLALTARAAQPRMANVSTGVNDSCAAAANATSTQSDSGALNLAISIILTVAGAALLAFTMVVQRYGLAYPKPRIPMCGLKIPRLLVWFFGMVLYGPANGLKIAAWSLGPQSALGSIFSILLIFNLIFARWLLKETITTAKVASSLIILAGAITCTIGAPTGVKVNFTDRDIVLALPPVSRSWIDE